MDRCSTSPGNPFSPGWTNYAMISPFLGSHREDNRLFFFHPRLIYLLVSELPSTESECADGEVCAVPTVKRGYRVLFWVVTALVALSAVAPYVLSAFMG